MEDSMAIRSKGAALTEAVKRWGKDGCVRDSGRSHQTTPESRAVAVKALEAHKVTEPTRPANQSDRAAWPDEMTLGQYRATWTAYTVAKKAYDDHKAVLWGEAFRRRYAVGKILGGFAFHVYGEGDTWDDAFENARTRSGR